MKPWVKVLIVTVVIAAPAFGQAFTDVPADHWAYDAANQLQKDGILIGYPDGTFQPANEINFAEASKVQGSKATGENSQAEDREKIRNRRADIFFWTGTFITAILLALGRYFPLYRLFYMLPYVSSMRCPAKFLHLVEFALCILFAFGLEAFSRDTKMVNAVAVKNGTQVEKRKAGKRS